MSELLNTTALTTRSQQVAADVVALIKARVPVLWIVTKEEPRVERYLFVIAQQTNYFPRTWDVAQGAADMSGKLLTDIGSRDPGEMLATILQRSQGGGDRGLWIMRDLPIWLTGQPGAAVCRLLRNIANARPTMKQENAQAIVILSPSGQVPDELSGVATVIDWPLPDRAELAELFDATVAANESGIPGLSADMTNGKRDAAIDAALGLSEAETRASYSTSLAKKRTIDARIVSDEKKRIIAKERVLTWHDPLPGGLDAVGGLEPVKTWFKSHACAYTRDAREYGLQSPKGFVLVGVPGCGKSYFAKAASAWRNVPLLQWDFGALKNMYVGKSEENFRKSTRVIDAIGPCIIWVDEIEKMLSGATQGAADGGVSADALGTFLTWMQERTGDAFVIATANDVQGLPPELLRAGRFDAVWFVDLPTLTERQAILSAALKTNKQDASAIDLAAVAGACVKDNAGFTGAEIASLVPDAMFVAYNDGKRKLETRDLIAVSKQIVPLAKTAETKIAALRQWAAGRARPASLPETATAERQLQGVEI